MVQCCNAQFLKFVSSVGMLCMHHVRMNTKVLVEEAPEELIHMVFVQ